ncbi:MAG: transcriptional repressor [Candidatus Izemoplasmatales bacterium]|jgi:Fur family ferric uptake transcriptional regulator|nr:transcriptional repressor [Candidatus Izemoplasmatales bacterium]
MNDIAILLDKLKNNGLKNTKHRIEILKMLDKTDIPVSADKIYAKLKKTDILISLSTVYRTLETLIEKELVMKVQFESETKALYEMNKETHHHFFVCVGCNKIFPLKECPIHEHDFEVEDSEDFEVIGHKLELYGYCKECQKKRVHLT